MTFSQLFLVFSLWAIGNLAGDGPEFRSILHANGALTPATQVFISAKNSTTATTAAWALSNLAKGRETPAMPFLQCGVLTPIICSISFSLQNNQQEQQQQQEHRMLIIESCWLLAHLTAKETEAVHYILSPSSTTSGAITSNSSSTNNGSNNNNGSEREERRVRRRM